MIMDKQIIEQLKAQLGNENPKVVVGAMVALAKYADVDLLPEMLGAVTVRPAKMFGLENSGWKMQQAIARVALKNPNGALPYLTAALGHSNQAVQEVAAGIMEALYQDEPSLVEDLFNGVLERDEDEDEE